MIDSSRAVCGIATCFGVPGRANWQPEAFEAWLGLGLASMRIDHGPLLSPQGFIASIGTARRFQPMTSPVNGVLVLAEVDHGGFGDSLLHDLAQTLRQLWLPGWGMSLTAITTPDTTDILPIELSLTRDPHHEGARVLAVGSEAIAAWRQFIEEECAVIKETA